MDEPFGAVDPITRGHLQDELLRLQNELRKTIVFVTHDFDEAVKLGDKIAVLGERSTILQYDTPDAILANPADDTVAGFVGAGASLKALTLMRVRDVELGQAVTASADADPSTVDLDGERFLLVLDQRGRPLRWVHVNELKRGRPLTGLGRPVEDSVTLQSTLRDALEAMVNEGGRAVVTGNKGEYVGTLDLTTVTEVVQRLRASA